MKMNTIEIITAIADITTTLGVFLAIGTYYLSKKKDREENARLKKREKEDYALRVITADNRFYDFLEICSRHPNLHCYLLSDDTIELSENDKITRINIYEILVCVFERVFIVYKDLPEEIKKTQEAAWGEYIRRWFQKESFLDAWNKIKETYDIGFVELMEKNIK